MTDPSAKLTAALADLRHDRNVALKVLRPELAAVIGGERFLKEIKVTPDPRTPEQPIHVP
jgi:hypothetical protein